MTNEEYIKAIDMRRSRRTYRSVMLDKDTMGVIKKLVDVVNEKTDLEFHFIEDASPAFSFFSGKFSCIAVCGPDTERARILSGYYGELIVLECAYHGLGTCWATGNYNEDKICANFGLNKDLKLFAVIVVGFVKPTLSAKEKIVRKITHKVNKPYLDMFVALDSNLPPYYEYAMKLVEKAPSSTNSRPVRFKYENGVISGKIIEPYSIESIDLGIAQLHFQIGAVAKGLKGEWDRFGRFCTDDSKVIKFPESGRKVDDEDE